MAIYFGPAVHRGRGDSPARCRLLWSFVEAACWLGTGAKYVTFGGRKGEIAEVLRSDPVRFLSSDVSRFAADAELPDRQRQRADYCSLGRFARVSFRSGACQIRERA